MNERLNEEEQRREMNEEEQSIDKLPSGASETQRRSQFVFRRRIRNVNFVAENHKRHIRQIFAAQQRVELGFRFRKPIRKST